MIPKAPAWIHMTTCNWPALLTGTVIVDNEAISRLNEPLLREKQYLENLHWLGKANSGLNEIIFCENSAANLSSFDYLKSWYQRHQRHIEIHKVPMSSNVRFKGKGWGEGIIMKWVQENSPCMLKAESFIKITGRYRICNIRRINAFICRALARTPDIQFIGYGFYPKANGRPYIQTSFFWSKRDFFNEHLSKAYLDVNDVNGIYLEHVWAERLVKIKDQANIYSMPMAVMISARAGWNAEPIMSWRQLVRSEIRQRFFPLPELVRL